MHAESVSIGMSATSALLALVFANHNYPVLTMLFSIMAFGSALYAIRKVNELGRIVQEDAERQREQIVELPLKGRREDD